MLTKRLNEIAERRKAIGEELKTADLEQIRKLKTEADALDTEEATLQERASLEGKLGKPIGKPDEKNDAEERGRALMQGRAVTVATTGILLEEHQATNIRPTFNQVSTLIDRVNVVPLPGGETFKQPYEAGHGEGDYTAEGTDYAEAEPTFGYAEIKKTKITAYSEVSEELVKLPAANFERVVMQGIPKSVRRKITGEILVGNGATGHFVGIFNSGATAIDPTTDIDFSEIDEETLDEIIFSFGGDENVEDVSVLVLNKVDLKAFAKLRDANGRKIHEVKPNGNSGTIDGVPYIINSKCKAISAPTTTAGQYCMAYGPISNYTMGVFSDLEVMRSTDYKFKQGMIAHKGSIFAGGNVAAKNGFLRVKKA